MTHSTSPNRYPGSATLTTLNTRWHRRALAVFMVIVLAHWAEHVTQAVQIYALGWPVHQAGGMLGVAIPWLVHSEWLHFGYALAMLVGLVLLRPGFQGRARVWWTIALAIQAWHFLEHSLLYIQATTGWYLGGRPVPTSVLQLIAPRVELHLFYNAIVFTPMVIAIVLHMWPRPAEQAAMRCKCPVGVAASAA